MDADETGDAELFELLRVLCALPVPEVQSLASPQRRWVHEPAVRLDGLPDQERILLFKCSDTITKVAQRCHARLGQEELDYIVTLFQAFFADHDDVAVPPDVLHARACEGWATQDAVMLRFSFCS